LGSKTAGRPGAGHIYRSKNMTTKTEESNKALVFADPKRALAWQVPQALSG
jgi:hypothetical protein